MSVKQTLADLVRINSVSSISNREIADYLVSRCESLKLKVQRFPYTDDSGIEKQNLIALAGADFSDTTAVELALVGHTDTVPFDPNWNEALRLTERDEKLFGRGSCDTKAFIAATLTAVELLDFTSLRHPLALIFTADEEVGLLGAKRLAAEKPLTTRYSIVGEPTSLQPMRAGKGYSLAEIIVRGREAHSAYPAVGASAIFRASHLLARLEAIARQLEAEQHAAFDPPFTTLNVGLIRGGTAKNVIAGECRMTLEWRTIPGQPSERLLDLWSEAVAEERRQDPELECEINATRTDGGFETAPDSELVTLLETLTGKTAGTVAFGTEAAQLKHLGADAVVLGPGDIREAHRTGEFVPVAELEECVEILKQSIERLCK